MTLPLNDHEDDRHLPLLLQQKKIRFFRLLHAMERKNVATPMMENTTAITITTRISSSWQAIEARADLLQSLWDELAPWYETNEQVSRIPFSEIDHRVRNAISMNLQIVPAEKEGQEVVVPLLNQIFPARTAETTPHRKFTLNEFDTPPGSLHETDEAVAKTMALNEESSAYNREPLTSAGSDGDVQDLQKTQREQIESAISQMASQLKLETERIHTTLQDQSQALNQMEDIAADNVEKLTRVSSDVKQHVSKTWMKTIGRWTMIFTIAGSFVFTLFTIQMLPKHKGACLFFCSDEKRNKRLCRTLPSGDQECISIDDCRYDETGKLDCTSPSSAAKVKSKERVDLETEKYEEAYGDKEGGYCEVDMYGNCVHEGDEDPEPDFDSEDEESEDESEDIEEGDLSHLESMPPAEQLRAEALRDYYDSVEATRNQAMEKQQRRPPRKTSVSDQPRGEVDEDPDPFDAFQATEDQERGANDHQEEDELDPFAAYDPVIEEVAQTDESSTGSSAESSLDFTLEDVRWAAATGDVQALDKFLSIRPDFANIPDENRWTPLHLAVRHGSVDAIRVMLSHGADPHLRTNSEHNAAELAMDYHGKDSLILTVL